MQAWQLEERPRIEHRVLGLDRRSIIPALAVLAVAILWAVVMPFINSLIDADEVESGTVMDAGRGVQFTTAGAWLLGVAAANAQNGQVELFLDGITFTVKTGAFDGTSQELLDLLLDQRDEFEMDGGVRAVTLSQGITGVATQRLGVNFTDALFTFAYEGTGLEIEVSGPPLIDAAHTELIAHMIASIQFDVEGATS